MARNPTLKQRKAAKAYIENGGIASRAMIAAGYSPQSAVRPEVLTKAKGFKQVLKEWGLTEELITTSLVSDIKAKPGKRVPELTLGANVLRMTNQDVPREEEKLVVNLLQFNAYHNDSLQHRPEAKTVPGGDNGASGEVQVIDFTPESGEDSAGNQ